MNLKRNWRRASASSTTQRHPRRGGAPRVERAREVQAARMSRFVLAPAARDDLDEIHAYIAADNPDAAEHTREAAFATFAMLAQTPGLGRARRFRHSLLTDLRSFGIRGFTDYLVFY